MDLVTSRQDNLWDTLYQTFTFPGRNGAILFVVLYLCLLAGKVLLGITLLGKSCHYRSSPSPPCSHSSNNLIGQSSSHMTTQGSFIPPILSPRYRILGRWFKSQANRCWGRKLSTYVASVNLNH